MTAACDGRPCPGCGRSGCLEAYVSGTSIAARAREALAAGDGTSALALSLAVTAAASPPRRVPATLASAIWIETHSPCAQQRLDRQRVEPEIVVVGGGVTSAGECSSRRCASTSAEAMTPAGCEARVVRAALNGEVGVVGAAAIAVERLAEGRLLPL